MKTFWYGVLAIMLGLAAGYVVYEIFTAVR